MQATIGIDVGGSTTKIVGFRHTQDGGRELIVRPRDRPFDFGIRRVR